MVETKNSSVLKAPWKLRSRQAENEKLAFLDKAEEATTKYSEV
jgi:hypothetical protein